MIHMMVMGDEQSDGVVVMMKMMVMDGQGSSDGDSDRDIGGGDW